MCTLACFARTLVILVLVPYILYCIWAVTLAPVDKDSPTTMPTPPFNNEEKENCLKTASSPSQSLLHCLQEVPSVP